MTDDPFDLTGQLAVVTGASRGIGKAISAGLLARGARVVLVGGQPLGRRHMVWNFVSSHPERIVQAQDDWRERRFEPVPGETEYIALP